MTQLKLIWAVMAHTLNPSTSEAKVDRSLNSWCDAEKSCLKNNKKLNWQKVTWRLLDWCNWKSTVFGLHSFLNFHLDEHTVHCCCGIQRSAVQIKVCLREHSQILVWRVVKNKPGSFLMGVWLKRLLPLAFVSQDVQYCFFSFTF